MTVTSNNVVHQDTGWKLMHFLSNIDKFYQLTIPYAQAWLQTRCENQCWKSLDLGSRRDTWMLKGVLINADSSAVMQDINCFTKIPGI